MLVEKQVESNSELIAEPVETQDKPSVEQQVEKQVERQAKQKAKQDIDTQGADAQVEEQGETSSAPAVISILDRRRQLTKQRRVRFWQTLWRTSAILGCTAGLGWAISLPEWKIQTPSQVTLLGNTQLSTQTLAQLLPIRYPSSLIRIQPQAIAHQFKQHAHIESVTVSRQLFPPKVDIFVQERPPVAKTHCESCVLGDLAPYHFKPDTVWLLDANGIPLPLASYPELSKTQKLPNFTVVGFLQPSELPVSRPNGKNHSAPISPHNGSIVKVDAQKQKQWRSMLPQLSQSAVKIHELDWQDPQNLKLKTPLGLIHLGPFSQKLPSQLQALDKMRSLGSSINLDSIQYIDISDPEHPILELKPIGKKVTPQKP